MEFSIIQALGDEQQIIPKQENPPWCEELKSIYVTAANGVISPNTEQAVHFVQECIEFYMKFQINILTLIYHTVQAPEHTHVKKCRGGLSLKKQLEYIFEPLDIFLDSQQAEFDISIAMLTSLLSRELLTQQQYNDCVEKLQNIYIA